MSKPATIRVLLADDHQVVRQGLMIFLNTSSDITVIAEAQNGLEAIARVNQDPPDVVLMDLVMPELDGIQATRQIKAAHPEVEVIALTILLSLNRGPSTLASGPENLGGSPGVTVSSAKR